MPNDYNFIADIINNPNPNYGLIICFLLIAFICTVGYKKLFAKHECESCPNTVKITDLKKELEDSKKEINSKVNKEDYTDLAKKVDLLTSQISVLNSGHSFVMAKLEGLEKSNDRIEIALNGLTKALIERK